MLVKCVQTQGEFVPLVLPVDINLPLGDNNFCSSNEWFTINSKTSGFNLSYERCYRVYGFLIVNGKLRYLISDNNNIPGFFPDMLFQVVDHSISLEWVFSSYTSSSNTVFFISPSDFNSYGDILGIMSSNPYTIRKHIEYREWLDKWEL